MIASTSSENPGPLSIVHALAPGRAGGLESVVVSLARGHQSRGHQVSIISIVEDGQPEPGLHRALRGTGVNVIAVPLPPRRYSRERAAYGEHFSSLKPDVVHTHGYRSDVLAGQVAGRARLPRVTTVHGFTGGDWKNRLYEFLQIRAFRRFDRVVAVSEPLAQKLLHRGVPRPALTIIPNGYDAVVPPLDRAAARRQLGLADDQIVLGWVGRMSREKGLDVLLDALPLLADLEVTLAVVGDGAQRRSLDEQASRLGVGSRVRWHGLVPDAATIYRAFDLFVLSSRTEGTPISLLEAMAAGTPIVATAVGGVPDVLRDQLEGRLVPAESPAALAAAIREVLGDGGVARSRADRALARLHDVYALGPWLDRYDQVYRSVLSTNRG